MPVASLRRHGERRDGVQEGDVAGVEGEGAVVAADEAGHEEGAGAVE